jgi:MFS family permease
MAAFSLVFSIAAIARLVSVLFLYLQTERKPKPMIERYVTLRDLSSGRKSASSVKLLAYLFVVQIGVYIAGPFYAPYMLKKLEMPYHTFAILIGITFFGKVIALPFWGQLAHLAGPKKLLWIGGVGIGPVAGLWSLSQNVYFLCVLQFIGGVTWAAYELAMFLMFLETIPRNERTSVLTVYNLGNALAQVAGALFGAAFLVWQRRTPEAYLGVFILSSAGRALALIFLTRVPDIDITVHTPPPIVDPLPSSHGDSVH